jgi:hypothetical protein
MKELTDYEKGFLDGLIDGEGSITLTKEYARPNKRTASRGWQPRIVISIANNSLELLDKTQKILGTNLKPVVKLPKKPTHNISYQIGIGHGLARDLLPQLSFGTIDKERRRLLAMEILTCLENGNNQYTNTLEKEKKLISLCERWYI